MILVHVCCVLPSPHNQIYSRFWYAFSLFLRKFYSVNPFYGNFCEPGRAWFAEEKMEFPSQVVSKTYSILIFGQIRTDFEPVQGPCVGHARWTCGMNLWSFCVANHETPPPYGAGNLVSFNWKTHISFGNRFDCVEGVTYRLFVNVYFKTTIIKQNIKIILLKHNIHVSEVHCGSAVRFGQALSGFLITAHHLYAFLS